MTEHLTQSATGEEVTAWCKKCHRLTAHRADRVSVNTTAAKPGPCLEHASQWMTHDQLMRRDEQKRQRAQLKLFEGHHT